MSGFSSLFLNDDDDDEDLIEPRRVLSDNPEDFFAGQFLVAMPHIGDSRFENAVVYLCAHNASGAMGIVLNKEHDSVSLLDMFEQLDIQPNNGVLPGKQRNALMDGGPVETSRGFVLHTLDYQHDSTVEVSENLGLTASVDILNAINDGQGPNRYVIALGCSAWSGGQLEEEFLENTWLNVPADEALLFDLDRAKLWRASITKLGIDPGLLHATAGSA